MGVLNYEAWAKRLDLSDSPAVAYLDVALVLDVVQRSECLLETRPTT